MFVALPRANTHPAAVVTARARRSKTVTRAHSTAVDIILGAIALSITADVASTFIKQMNRNNKEVIEPVVMNEDSDDEEDYRDYNIRIEILDGKIIDASKDDIDLK